MPTPADTGAELQLSSERARRKQRGGGAARSVSAPAQVVNTHTFSPRSFLSVAGGFSGVWVKLCVGGSPPGDEQHL